MPDVQYPDGLVVPGGRVTLSAEPVFVAALDRAQQAGRDEIGRIAVRSSEFNAINNALTLFVRPAPAGVVMAQVDFAVSHPALAKPWLAESFAGHGTTWRDAIGGAVSKFKLGALHPIVDGLLRPGAAPGQVERERYEHPSGAFELVLGAQINLFADRPVPSVGPLLDRLLEALRVEPLTPKVHGLRLFVAHHDGRLQTNEVLLDGEQWSGGEAVVTDSKAPLLDGRVAVRIFGLLVPVDNA